MEHANNLQALAYLASAVLFILALKGLTHPASARRGNFYAMIGMAIAVAATKPGSEVVVLLWRKGSTLKVTVTVGEIQDAEVFLQTLAEFQSGASSPDPDPARHYYESRHADAIFAYLKAKDMLDEFWRLAPEEPFPWEKTK